MWMDLRYQSIPYLKHLGQPLTPESFQALPPLFPLPLSIKYCIWWVGETLNKQLGTFTLYLKMTSLFLETLKGLS